MIVSVQLGGWASSTWPRMTTCPKLAVQSKNGRFIKIYFIQGLKRVEMCGVHTTFWEIDLCQELYYTEVIRG
jgi:hypothetical protein